ncbi:MAG: tetratricopeptide repeat protein, partial [Desulfovibrio sp.]|nr:tetratricopeptide repeat protein [Desulfovibrio sp.]
GENFAAEYEYSRALKVDEENVRANLGIGITYMERGELEKAENIFERLVKLESAFESEHKHLFNEFGINLRKNKMLKQAVEYYKKAIELSENDENLRANLARALLEAKDIDGCLEQLFKALELAPAHPVSLKFLDWMERKSLIPDEKIEQARVYLAGYSDGKDADAQ